MEPRDLSALDARRPGPDVETRATELGLDPDEVLSLHLNTNPLGPSPAAVDAVRDHAGRVHSYPKAAHADLRSALADEHGVETDQIWLSPGGAGALEYLGRAFLDPGQRVLVPEPGFGYTATNARYHHAAVDTYRLAKDDDFAQSAAVVLDAYDDFEGDDDVDADEGRDADAGHRLVHVASPHNPTGSEMPLAEIDAVADATADQTLLVVDEAYGQFSGRESAVSLVAERDDVAVVRTFSKAHGLAGMRLGYAVTPEEWADAYARVATPFAVTELACRAGLAALDDREHVAETVETVRWSRSHLREELDARTWPSGGNFVLADVGDAETVAARAARRGLFVRNCSGSGLPGCVRIACGTRTETRRAVDILGGVLSDDDRSNDDRSDGNY